MRFIFTIALLLLTFGNVYGDDLRTPLFSTIDVMNKVDSSTNQLELTASNSIFNQLGDMFAQGTLPTKEETYGWWSGRCYISTAQNTPLSILLASRTIKAGKNNDGPAFPSKEKHQMTFIKMRSKSNPDFFDEGLTAVLGAEIKAFLEQTENLAEEENGSLSSKYGGLKFSIRKHQDYFVGQSIVLNDQNGWKAGDVHASCYFFKKVYSY